MTEVLKPIDVEMFTDHIVLNSNRYVYNYNKGDFAGLCSVLRAANFSSLVSPDNTNIISVWCHWKDAVLAAVADFIPRKKLKGRNLAPLINGAIINLIPKKISICKQLKQYPTNHLKEEFRKLLSEIKHRTHVCRDAHFENLESDLRLNPKHFWS